MYLIKQVYKPIPVDENSCVRITSLGMMVFVQHVTCLHFLFIMSIPIILLCISGVIQIIENDSSFAHSDYYIECQIICGNFQTINSVRIKDLFQIVFQVKFH